MVHKNTYKVKNPKNLATLQIHGGQEIDATGASVVPIYQTTSYIFDSPQQAANRFMLTEGGNIYTRLTNPTTQALEARLAAIEGGTSAYATSCGLAAIFYTVLNLTKLGDNIVSGNNLYGGTFELFENTLKELGREVICVDSTDVNAFAEAINDKTKGIYVESIGNPKLDVPDFDALAEVAHSNGIPLIVDNTSGIGTIRPFDHGADIIASSCTKWIAGHGSTMGGIVIEKGDFPWDNGKFPLMTDPDQTYNGLVFYPTFGSAAFTTRIRATLGRDTGAIPGPFGSWCILEGLETLDIRIQRHAENAMAMAEFLKDHPKVEWVNYPGLEECETHANASKYCERGYGGVVTFGVKGGAKAADEFCEEIELCSFLVNIGDVKSLITHPASTTHSQLTEEEQIANGVYPELIRFAVGTEDIEDIKADVDNALNKMNV